MPELSLRVHENRRSFPQLWWRSLVVGIAASAAAQLSDYWPPLAALSHLSNHGRWMLAFKWICLALVIGTTLAVVLWWQQKRTLRKEK
jgi:hypothetical protein